MKEEAELKVGLSVDLGEFAESDLKGSICARCEQPHKLRRSPEWILLHFDGMVQRILIVLLEHRRKHTSATIAELRHASYAGAELPEPKNGRTSVHVQMRRSRERLNNLGWDYVGPRTSGAGYVLVQLE